MTTVKLNKRNQMVLPKEARDLLKVGPGDEVAVVPRSHYVLLIGNPKEAFLALKGSAKGVYGDVDEYLRRERASWRR